MSQKEDGNEEAVKTQGTAKTAIRHAEKRRISTCAFADRVAQAALEVYRAVVADPKPHPTCLAAILVHDSNRDALTVLALGVGTKFLTEATLRQEREKERPYGRRVRDLHAEVLCRRAFRRFLSERIHQDLLQGRNNDRLGTNNELLVGMDFLQRSGNVWRIREGCTLHAYFSSTPCGNATLKKFATLTKEVFRDDLDDDTWPHEQHAPQLGHSIKLGQFALLVKKDATTTSHSKTTDSDLTTQQDRNIQKRHSVPEKNIPAGTAPVHAQQGSLHTCSDKVCRWNCLGWQGSLLSTLFSEPLHIHSLTVGRKFSSVCLRRAVCCRVVPDGDHTPTQDRQDARGVIVRHPSVMCTAVYVDPDAVVVPKEEEGKNDMQFTNSLAYAWWPGLTVAHTIDGTTGYAVDAGNEEGKESLVCTKQLTEIFQDICCGMQDAYITTSPQTLSDLRQLKRRMSPEYELAKDSLLREHKVMRDWVRRSTSDEAN